MINAGKILHQYPIRKEIQFVLIAAIALLLFWPQYQAPKDFNDSASYLDDADWRSPVYAVFASKLGDSFLLCAVQTIVSIGAWAFLGFVLAGAVGSIVTLLFALSPPLFQWNMMVLSESLSLSLLALVLAFTYLTVKRWTWSRFILWGLVMALFGLTRTTNLFLLPFFTLPFLFKCRLKRLLPSVLLIFSIFIVGYVQHNTSGKWLQHMALTNILLQRILPDEEARDYFEQRGMPIDETVLRYQGRQGAYPGILEHESPEFTAWVTSRGVPLYKKYLLTHPGVHFELISDFPELVDENYAYYRKETKMPGSFGYSGVFIRNSATVQWEQVATAASQLAAGDLDGDSQGDIIGDWPGQDGVYLKSSRTGAWTHLSSSADSIACGDMNGDGLDDLICSWKDRGVNYWDSSNGEWVKIAPYASLITAGDLDSDGRDDLVGNWEEREGLQIIYSTSGEWSKLANKANSITCADMDGDGRDDLLGSWPDQGCFWLNSQTGEWHQLGTVATRVTGGDIDGDGIDDLIGTWPEQGGVWIRYSSTMRWEHLSKTADWITTVKNKNGSHDLVASWNKIETSPPIKLSGNSTVQRFLNLFYTRSRLPLLLWLIGLLLPLVSYFTLGRVTTKSLITAVLIPATYVQAFVAYHGDAGADMGRHMLTTLVLYRLIVLIMIFAVYEIIRFKLKKPSE